MRLTLISSIACGITTVFAQVSISKFPNSLTLSSPYDPIIAAYWTGLPHHRRIPFSVSPDGKSGYVAYLDAALKNVVVQQVDLKTFSAVGTPVTIPGREAAGLVAQNDGFALMATVAPTGSSNLPPNNYPIVKLFRYRNGVQAWATALNGPGVFPKDGLTATPDANGDLVYSPTSGLYGAYFVVTAYSGWAKGHFGDSIIYCSDNGTLQDNPERNSFGCSHQTGGAIALADKPPFATVCAEDHCCIWLTTDTRTMDGVKIANENTTNGVSGEPMGGMSGSYSNLALFPGTSSYIFAWNSRGSLRLKKDDWRGDGYTQCDPRWLHHNVAIALLSSKNKLVGPPATSVVGAESGDDQVNWITKSETEDHENVHVAAINSKTALVTYEVVTNPDCQPVPLSCTGTYAGTAFQVVDSTGVKQGAPVVDKSVFVSGNLANVGQNRLCWPYVDIAWDLSQPKSTGGSVNKLSFACASLGGSGNSGDSGDSGGASSPVAQFPPAAAPSPRRSTSGAAGRPAAEAIPNSSPPAAVPRVVDAGSNSAPTKNTKNTKNTKDPKDTKDPKSTNHAKDPKNTKGTKTTKTRRPKSTKKTKTRRPAQEAADAADGSPPMLPVGSEEGGCGSQPVDQ